ncbi:aspartate/glutamate racemase family protein [Herbidospora mongoliensis]|uniref:aspartate/glutamate racemase family protein n=1 Tax=Herbidospora mongoliensis TaxID=688067 RepID=UPI000AAC6669|nr:aspartate/glutamate racemase family protein [Herbidospora mongoliensis]
MIHVKVINPNTSRDMTEIIGSCAREVAAHVTAVSPAMGPASIESHYDEALAVPGILTELHGADAYVIACFGDPGLDAAREVADGPVIGIAEAAMHVATLVSRSFSVVTTLGRTVQRAWDLAERYGCEKACRGVHACEIPVLDLDDKALSVVAELAETALEKDGSEAIVLGCAGMGAYTKEIARRIDAPVIDGVQAAVTLAESLVKLRLTTSRRGEYASPPPKPYTGLLAGFEIK